LFICFFSFVTFLHNKRPFAFKLAKSLLFLGSLPQWRCATHVNFVSQRSVTYFAALLEEAATLLEEVAALLEEAAALLEEASTLLEAASALLEEATALLEEAAALLEAAGVETEDEAALEEAAVLEAAVLPQATIDRAITHARAITIIFFIFSHLVA